jgi:hypothetical protein
MKIIIQMEKEELIKMTRFPESSRKLENRVFLELQLDP